jgi:hypothetical protein
MMDGTNDHLKIITTRKDEKAMLDTTILDCGHAPSPHADFTTGYSTDAAGKTFCYDCCAEMDKAEMRKTGRATLYLVRRDGEWHVTNWPGSLDLKAYGVRFGRHNLAGRRVDFWFKFEGQEWHGYNLGHYSQIAHCKRLKAK